MHPGMLRQLAADHIRELITEADNARQAREARRARRRRPSARQRRSTRLYEQQCEPSPEPMTLVRSGADDRVTSGRS